MDKQARIFVAGHRGLIGSAFVRRLQAQGYTHLLTRSRAELELADRGAVFDFFRQAQPEYVILAAGKVGGIVANQTSPADFLTQNLDIQSNIFAAAQAFGVRRLLFFASSCMYPRACPQPMTENALLTGAPEPTSMAYAMAKLAGTQLCLAYNAQYGAGRFLPVIPNSVYGENDNFDPTTGHVLSALIRRFHIAKTEGAETVTLWGSGAPKREFLFADDLVDACQRLLDHEGPLELPINIGSGEEFSIKELAEAVADSVGYAGRIAWDRSKPDGAPRKLLDSTRMRSLGWTPQTPLLQGLRHSYAWYLREGRRKNP